VIADRLCPGATGAQLNYSERNKTTRSDREQHLPEVIYALQFATALYRLNFVRTIDAYPLEQEDHGETVEFLSPQNLKNHPQPDSPDMVEFCPRC